MKVWCNSNEKAVLKLIEIRYFLTLCQINLLIFQITGAEAFIELEYPHEMELFAEKQAAARRVDDAADYLGKECAMTIIS